MASTLSTPDQKKTFDKPPLVLRDEIDETQLYPEGALQLHLLETAAEIEMARILTFHQYQIHFRPDLPRLSDEETLNHFYPYPGPSDKVFGITTADGKVLATCLFELFRGGFGGHQLVKPLDPEGITIEPHENCLEIGRLAIDHYSLKALFTNGELFDKEGYRNFMINFYRQIFDRAKLFKADRLFIVVKPVLHEPLTTCFRLDSIPCTLYPTEDQPDETAWHYNFLPGYFENSKEPLDPTHYIEESLDFNS